MRAWQRASFRTFCGRCGAEIGRGDPMLVIQVFDAKWKKSRCPNCAGEAVPVLPELAARVVVEPTSKPLRENFSAIAALAKDYKLKQAGD